MKKHKHWIGCEIQILESRDDLRLYEGSRFFLRPCYGERYRNGRKEIYEKSPRFNGTLAINYVLQVKHKWLS